MASRVNRRAALGLGTAVTAGAVLGTGSAAAAMPVAAEPSADPRPRTPRDQVRAAYQQESARAGGRWLAYISLTDASGTPVSAVEVTPDETVEAYSVNKIAVATAVLDKIDRGQLSLSQRVDVTSSIVVPPDGDGIFCLDGAYPSSVTLGHVLAALLTVSDDTAVRLCGLVCPAAEINSILVAKGFPNTQVELVANPNRFYLGTTTPRDMHNMLYALVKGTLLSPASTSVILDKLRSPIAFTDGIRRTMSSAQRARIGTKAGWYADARNEAGIIFNSAGAPALIYSMFADGMADPDNFGTTHPGLQARAAMGPRFLTAVDSTTTSIDTSALVRRPAVRYRPSNGG